MCIHVVHVYTHVCRSFSFIHLHCTCTYVFADVLQVYFWQYDPPSHSTYLIGAAVGRLVVREKRWRGRREGGEGAGGRGKSSIKSMQKICIVECTVFMLIKGKI